MQIYSNILQTAITNWRILLTAAEQQLLPETGNTLVQKQDENKKHAFLLITDFLNCTTRFYFPLSPKISITSIPADVLTWDQKFCSASCMTPFIESTCLWIILSHLKSELAQQNSNTKSRRINTVSKCSAFYS